VNTSHDRFFLFYNNGKCTRQPVGINTFGQLPSKIAAYLTLEDPKTYTGHCFRRSSATLLAAGGGDLVSLKRHGGWRSSTVAEGYIGDCVEERIKIARKVFGGTTTELSTSDTSSSSSTNGVQYFYKCEFYFHTNEKNEN
jgi:hypothetical protein